MKIYVEFTVEGKFNNAIFTSWNEYHAATFNPEINILLVKVIR